MDPKTKRFLLAAAIGVVSAAALVAGWITVEQFRLIVQALSGM